MAGPLRAEVARSAKRARNRTSDRALPRFTREVAGIRRIVEEPPLITRPTEQDAVLLAEALDEYLATLSPHWRRVLGGYTLVDARTSGASMIAGYMGRSDRVDTALSTFARRYADQTEADHAALVAAVDRGMLPVERGV
jgi:hypothetical protein